MSTQTPLSFEDWQDPTFRRFVTGAVRELVREDGASRCFYVDEESHDGTGFVPCLVTEDVAGYSPMANGTPASVWRWGPTLEDAQAMCALVNWEGLAVDEDTADFIVGSSMAAQDDEDLDDDEDGDDR